MPTIRSILDIITGAGLTSGLKICLDAADVSSYSGSGDTFTDRSGNSNNFKRGQAAGSDSADPTFNGSAGGLSASEYFSFDGGDNLTVVGSNPLQSFHKDNAKGTILFGIYPVQSGVFISVIGDNVFSVDLGFRIQIHQTAARLVFATGNGSANPIVSISSAVAVPNSAWSIDGVSFDEAVGANGGFHFVNGTVELFNSTATSPSASNSPGVLCVSGNEGATAANRFLNGSRLAWVAVWEGVALTQAQVKAIFYEAGLRFGLTAGGEAALSCTSSLAAVGSAMATGSASLSGSGSLTCTSAGAPEAEEEPIHPIASLPIAAFDEPVVAEDEDLLRLNTSAVIDLSYLVELRPFAPAGTSLPS
jgi:hypothetical protein